ncbi:hypothetical protein JZM24_12010 [Candidatus Sodalis endolongispinus]|uniref:Uncharacterized protein n=1 Tax=Candidatus Sodalis endolongispinus TaxID=2812662 RepID=A0ABS5YCJ6_9GAMM|nr:hypothetical protein [Candidatus Sodalis endolongispinus]MBT9432666.1 hypothetical protein [Candidatus Sodalis endolongispinus]
MTENVYAVHPSFNETVGDDEIGCIFVDAINAIAGRQTHNRDIPGSVVGQDSFSRS